MSALADKLERLDLAGVGADRLLSVSVGEVVFPLPGWQQAGLVTRDYRVTEKGHQLAQGALALKGLLARGHRYAGPLLLATRSASLLLACRFADAPLALERAAEDAARLAAYGLLKREGGGYRLTLAGVAFLARAQALADVSRTRL